jgi:probable rRNA maturation factor
MRLEIAENADGPPLDIERLRNALTHAFDARIDGTVSLALVGNDAIAGLNRQFLGHDGPTDVLAFPLSDPNDPDPENLFGEVVVSLEMAQAEAAERSLPLFEEVFRYCVHGILHLLGHDDRTRPAARKMTQEQEEIVARYGR